MKKRPTIEHPEINGPAGVIETLLETPAEERVQGCALICHPHPLYGGTMQNKVVHTLARAFNLYGYAALRFNFRGVGTSAGSHDDGHGEVADAQACLTWLQQIWPSLPLYLAGFSFGAMVALNLARTQAPDGLITVAPPVGRYGDAGTEQPDCDWLIIQGDADDLVDVDDVVSWVDGLQPGPELLVIPEADHFFHGRLLDIRDNVVSFLESDYDRPHNGS